MKNSCSSSNLLISGSAGFFAERLKHACLAFIAILLLSSGLLQTAFAADRPLGDIDGDGVVSVLDIVNLNKHASKQGTLEEGKKIYADLNQDGVINDADREILVKGILETETPENLPLAKVREASPTSGESNVAVTRETILYLTMPLSSTINTSNLYAKFGDRKLLTRAEISSDKRKVTLFYLEPIPASATITVYLDSTGLSDLVNRPIDADGDGIAGGIYTTSFTTLGITALPNTGVVGRVLASEQVNGADVPIAGAIITVDGMEETLRTVTDANGNFTLSPAPAGSFFVHIDGREAPIGGQDMTKPITERDYYPFVGKKWYAEAGNSQNKSGDIDDTPNQGGGTGVIYLPLVKAGSLKTVSATETTVVTAPPLDDPELNAAMQGVKLQVPPGSLFSDDGTVGGSVGIAPVEPDRLPSPLPEGLDLPLVITVQTDGPTNFDRPVPVTFPNLPDPVTGEKLGPGEKSALWSFNHDTGKWEIVGPMTVTEDGDFVETDAGVGLLQPGWHGTRPGAWGEGTVCHACSKQVGEGWLEASELAYGISLNTSRVNNMYLDEVDKVTGNTHRFDSIQFKGSNEAPAGLTSEQYNSLINYIGTNQDLWWSQFSTVTASIGTPELLATAIKKLEKSTQGNPGALDWWSDVEGLVEFKPIQGKIVALDLPIRMTLLAWSTLAESDELDKAYDDWKDLKNKQQNLIGLIRGCLKSDHRKKEAVDLSKKNQDAQEALVAQIEKELAAWGELLEKTPDLETRTSESNTAVFYAPNPLASTAKTKDKAKQWLDYLKKVRSLLLLLQKKDQSLIDDLEDLIVLMDQYFTQLNPFVVDCAEETSKPIKDLYIRLQSPSLDERFISTSGFIARVLAARTPYLMTVYSVKTQTIGAVFFLSPATGASRQIPTVPMYPDKGNDEDKDGLSDQAEEILGTEPTQVDSDGDGMNDKAELENGTDPMINNTDPSSSKPVRTGIIGTLPVFNGVSAVDVDVEDNTMAVALGTAGIGIYDVTVATAPLRIKEYKVGGDVVSVAVGRDYAVGAAGSSGMSIVPLTVDPENPVESRVLKLKSPVKAVTTDGSLAYAGLENGDVVVVDLASGLEITRIETDLGNIEDIDYGGGYIYVRGFSKLVTLELGDNGFEEINEQGVNALRTAGGRRFRVNYGGEYVLTTDNIGYDVIKPADSFSRNFAVGIGRIGDGDYNFDSQIVQYGWKQIVPTGSGLGVAVCSPNSTNDGPHNIDVYDFIENGISAPKFLSTIDTPGLAVAASIYNGFAFVADSQSGVQVINFMPFDSKGIKPTIRLESNFDLTPDPATGKGKVDEGKRMLLKAIVSDDVMVRNVELYINGEKFAVDGNYPFEFTEITPLRSAMTEFKLKARAYDTGGNYEETDEITLELFPDSVPPRVVKNFPANDDLIAPLDKVWVRFSEPMDELSLGGSEDAQGAVRILSAGADKVLGNGDDVQIPFIGSFNTDTDIYTLSFEAPLEPGLYQFVVENTAKDLAGNALANPMTEVEFRVYSDDDSDEDGIPDDWEVKLGYDPLNPYSRWIASGGSIKIEDGEYDTDEDNLNDAGEIVMETMLDKPDSDGDGILDGNEDTDFDGLQDGMEIKYATDPFEVDTDGDGLDDNSEIADGTDPNLQNNMPLTLVSGAASYIIDASVPLITLLGDNPMTLFKGASFQDPGAEMQDDADVASVIKGNGLVNINTVGNYTLTYSYTDRSGKEATPVVRVVSVILNPLADEDGDGLTNGQESTYGTDPEKVDTDGDGFNDNAEVNAGSDPKDSDDTPLGYYEEIDFGGSYSWAQGKEVDVQLPLLNDGGYWIMISGQLPEGLNFNDNGRVFGVPTEAGIEDLVLAYVTEEALNVTRLRMRIIPATASGGGYAFSNLAGSIWGYFSGSADASGAYTGSGDGFNGSGDSFSGSGDGGFIGSGDGMGGWIGNKDGVGSEAMFHRPGGVAVGEDGTIYVSDTGNNAIRKIDANGQVTKLAGNFLGSADGNFLGSSDGVFSGSSDGTGNYARFKNPQGITIDNNGDILVADRMNHAIRKVSPDGVVTTVAGSFTGSGTGGLIGSSDGPASGARFDHPSDVVVDGAGNIYVADSGNHAIRKIDLSGNVTTLAGDLGYSGYQDGTADSGMFNSPQGIAIDANGNIIVADTTNGLIRKVSPAGVVTTIAGALFTNNSGAAFQGSGGESFTGSAGEGGRSGLSDKAYAWFTGSGDGFSGSADGFTGSSDSGFTGSADLGWPESIDGTGVSARFSFPTDVEVDSEGNIFVVDSGSNSIRKITPSGVVTTLGNTPEGFFYYPLGIAVDEEDRLIVTDSGNNRVVKSTSPSQSPPAQSPGGASQ